MGPVRQLRWIDLFRRLLAGGCMALVFLLGVFAQSPALHQYLHGAAATAGNDGCAIELFATGVSVPIAVTAAPPAITEWRESRPAVRPELYLDSPRYLLQPERGPPVC